jgi:SAM-dependent methyltransferase
MAGFEEWYRALATNDTIYARVARRAFGTHQYVGQQGFATRDELLRLGAAILRCRTDRLLDVCCGPGAPGHTLHARFGCTVVGIDTSLAAVRLASSRDPKVRGVGGQATDLPFSEATFDAALLLDSVASLRDTATVLWEIRRVLRPGGRLAVTAECGEPLRRTERALFTRSAPPTVLPVGELVRQLSTAGFAIIEVRTTTAGAEQVARRLADGLRTHRRALASELGCTAVDDLICTLTTLAEMLSSRRVEEVAIIAEAGHTAESSASRHGRTDVEAVGGRSTAVAGCDHWAPATTGSQPVAPMRPMPGKGR